VLPLPYRYSKAPQIPVGFVLETQQLPSPQALNRLLSSCNLETHPPKKLAIALSRSDCFLSILEDGSGTLSGFVRVTSDKGLNANLWDLAVAPGRYQEQLIAILVHRVLRMIRQDMPGCSISIATPSIAIKALEEYGFLLDPGGIRTMGFRV
tara:strand:- start:1992 stop:2447 length:456 start_codon:yes stop_codon:yes gene_type:complete